MLLFSLHSPFSAQDVHGLNVPILPFTEHRVLSSFFKCFLKPPSNLDDNMQSANQGQPKKQTVSFCITAGQSQTALHIAETLRNKVLDQSAPNLTNLPIPPAIYFASIVVEPPSSASIVDGTPSENGSTRRRRAMGEGGSSGSRKGTTVGSIRLQILQLLGIRLEVL